MIVRFGIVYRGQEAGWVVVQDDARGVLFQAESRLNASAVLRLYGLTGQERPLLIGVLEPEDGVLKLSRRMTKQTLRTAKVDELPTQYYLDDGKPGCSSTCVADEEIERLTEIKPYHRFVDDPLLQSALRAGGASLVKEEDMDAIHAPFAPGRAHPLHFALTACTIERTEDGKVAVLRKQKRSAKE